MIIKLKIFEQYKINNSSYILFIVIIGIAMFLINLLDTYTLGDDILYRFKWQFNENEQSHKINNITDLIHSQLIHYQTINGRWVVHTIGQFFLCFTHPMVYQIINSFLFLLLLHLSSIISVKSEYRLFAIILIFSFIFIVFSGFKTAILWNIGTFNYLWVLVITLIFLLYLNNIKNKHLKLIHWITSPFVFFIGCSHEGICLPLSLTFIFYIINNKKNTFKNPIFLYIFWYLIGAAVCILSPGIWNRAGNDISLTERMLSALMNIIFNIRITWILFIVLLILWKRNKGIIKNELFSYGYYYVTLVLSIGIVILCGTNVERVAFFADFISLLILIRLLSENINIKWQKFIIIVCCLILPLFYIPALLVRYENKINYNQMYNQMIKSNKEIIMVKNNLYGNNNLLDFFRNRYVNNVVEFGYYCCYMAFNNNDINIRQAAQLYNKQKMIFLPSDVIEKIQSDSTAFENYELDASKKIYVWLMKEHKKVNNIVFHLKPENTSNLLPHQLLVTFKKDTYKLDKFYFNIVEIENRSYLVFVRPTTNIYRRIDYIEYF